MEGFQNNKFCEVLELSKYTLCVCVVVFWGFFCCCCFVFFHKIFYKSDKVILNLKIENTKNSKVAFSTARLSQTVSFRGHLLKHPVDMSPYFAKKISGIQLKTILERFHVIAQKIQSLQTFRLTFIISKFSVIVFLTLSLFYCMFN